MQTAVEPPAPDRSPHAPKRLALASLAAGRLSPPGKRRVLAHLAKCTVCSAEWPRVRASLQTVRDASQSMPRLDWARMEKTLAQVAMEESRQLRVQVERKHTGHRLLRFALPGAVVLAAAAALVLYLRRKRPEEPIARRPVPAAPAPRTPRERPPAPETDRPRLLGRVMAVVGSLERATGRLTANDDVQEGDELRTADLSRADVRFCAAAGCEQGRGTGVVLEASSRLGLAVLRRGAVELHLVDGAVASSVRPIGEGERYEVRTRQLVLSVEGTRFRVQRADEGAHEIVVVDVTEGTVQVRHLPTGRQNRLVAPARMRFVDGIPDTSASVETPSVATPHGVESDATGWALVHLAMPASERGRSAAARWRLASGIEGSTSAELMIRPGREVIEWTLGDGRIVRTPMDLTGGTTIDPTLVLASLRGTARVGTLPRDAIARVARAGLPAIRRCYEHRLRRRPDLEARVTVRLSISASGDVESARVVGEDAAGLAECVLPNVRGWTFPAPDGGTVSVDIPIAFAASQ